MSRADRAYRLVHTRGPRRLLRGPAEFETVEVVDIATNEPVLLWDVPAREARGFIARLRADLVGLEAGEFLERWSQEQR
jgi:hypothetical protein